jgi:cell division septation protein DedD
MLDRPSHSESSPQPVSKAVPAPSSTLPAPPDRTSPETFTFYKTLQAPAHAKPEPPGLEPKSSVILQGRTPETVPNPLTQVQKSPSKGYAVQVAAFRDRPAAVNLIHHLKEKKYPAYLLTAGTGSQETWYRVRVGPYATRAQAEDAARALKAKERLGSYIAFDRDALKDDLSFPSAVLRTIRRCEGVEACCFGCEWPWYREGNFPSNLVLKFLYLMMKSL